MTIKFGVNIATLKALSNLSKTNSSLQTTYERLSSGQRINSAKDDSAGLILAESLKTDSGVFTQGVRNLNQGISLLSVAEEALTELTNIVERIQELANQATSSSYSTSQRKTINDEAQSLADEYFRIARSTKYNSLELFNGGMSNFRLQAGYGEQGGITSSLGGTQGDGTFTLGTTATDTTINGDPQRSQVADVNLDGNQDIILEDGGAIVTLLGDGTGNFNFASETVISSFDADDIRLGDFNGDGYSDVAVGEGGDTDIRILFGNGDGTFDVDVTITVTGETALRDIQIADVDNDGDDDLIVNGNFTDEIAVFRSNGDGTFGSAESVATVDGAYDTHLADFNNDGYLDLVTASDSPSNVIAVHLNNGNGTFGAVNQIATSDTPFNVQSGDMNNDGFLDLIVGDNVDGTISVMLGNGDGTFQTEVEAIDTGVGNRVSMVAGVDINGDNILDVIAVDQISTETAYVYYGTGDGTTFTAGETYNDGGDFTSLVVADFNNDTVYDFSVIKLDTTNEIQVWLGDTMDGVGPLLAFDLTSTNKARQAVLQLEDAHNELITHKGTISAFQARAEVAKNNAESTASRLSEAESKIRDIDVAKETALMLKNKILQDTIVAILAQANQQPNRAYEILNGLPKTFS